MPDPEFISKLSSYNGIPISLLENTDVLDLFIPMIRADFTISETYVYSDEPPLSCPITAFGGISDPYVFEEEISSWKSHTDNKFKYYLFKGDHFFLTKESYTEVVHTIDKIIFEEIEKSHL